MLQFRQDDTNVELILTLTEKVSLTDPHYLFVFTHVLTKNTVKFIKASADDESAFVNRYNQFTINPSVVFEHAQPGEWHYRIYEQDDADNTDESATGAQLECGKLMLLPTDEFSFNKYDSATSYKAYNG